MKRIFQMRVSMNALNFNMILVDPCLVQLNTSKGNVKGKEKRESRHIKQVDTPLLSSGQKGQ